MRFERSAAIAVAIAATLSACNDSKADLATGAYTVRSDCAGASPGGATSVAQESPNVYRIAGGVAFGLPDELVRRENGGYLLSTGDARVCRARAYESEAEIMFVCSSIADGHSECTVLIRRGSNVDQH